MRRRLRRTIVPLFVILPLILAPSASASIRFVTKWGSEGTENGQFQRPYGVATDSVDNVYVVEHDGARVDKFTASGDFITKWGSSGSGAGEFSQARDIAVGASNNVYVADTGNDRIEQFSSSGSFIRQWGGSGSGNGEFDQPYGIATDSAGNVYVADAGNGRVQKFDSSGNFLASFTDNNDWGPFPTDVTLDSAGTYYTSEFDLESGGGLQGEYGLIEKHDPSGNYVNSWGSGSAKPVLAADSSDKLFVAEPQVAGGWVYPLWGDDVEEFDSSGDLITFWGTTGSGIGEFDSPSGIAISSNDRIYVSDTDNNRIQVFRRTTDPADTSITGGPQGTAGDSTPTFRFSSPDLDATFECKLDSGAYHRCKRGSGLGPQNPPRGPGQWTAPPLSDGTHSVRVRATDPNGTDPTPAVRNFTVRATDATAASVSGSTLVVTAGPGASNDIVIRRLNKSTFRVTDKPVDSYWEYRYQGSAVHAGAHCTRVATSAANCPAGMITRIRVTAGDQDDLVINTTHAPSLLAGGGGPDVLYGSFGPDTVIGGPGRDGMIGDGGNDLLLARDGSSDLTISCDGGDGQPEGHADKAELDRLPLDRRVGACELKTRR